MPLKLSYPGKIFKLSHEQSGAVFSLREWTVAMQDQVDRECLEQDGKGGIKWNVGKDRALKIELSLMGWEGVVNEDDSPVPCTIENARNLPVGIQVWLFKEIEERAGMRMTQAEKKS